MLDRLGSKADAANAELKRIRQELEIVRREQQQEREERREEMRRAALTPEQRAEEDRQKAEGQQKREAEAQAEAKWQASARHVAEDTAATGVGTALVFVMFVAALGLASWWTLVHTTPYEPPKSNQSTSNIQSADPNAQTPGTPVTDTKKRGGKLH